MILDTLLSTIKNKGAAYVVLLDPDRKDESSIQKRVENANISGVDALFVGGSLIMDSNCTERVKMGLRKI